MKREWIPNLATLGNLALGFVALLLILDSRFSLAAQAILLASLLDVLDGWLARALDATSPTGAMLDSMADLTSFGIAPALVVYAFVLHRFAELGIVSATLFALGAAFRLARHTVASGSSHFVGLPSTAAGGIVVGLVWYEDYLETGLTPLFFLLLTLTLTVLMVSRLPYRSFKRLNRPDASLWRLIPLAILIAVGGYFDWHSTLLALILAYPVCALKLRNS